MNDHGTMTVEVEENNETRHVSEYEHDDLKRTLSALPRGTTVPIKMNPVGVRGNVWKAVEFQSDTEAFSSAFTTGK
jgi:hypothetical protein